ncbi:MAG: HNH endonuclease [Nitrospirota bacterium]
MAIPKDIRDKLLVEAQHRCTICSERCFEIHHIIEQAEGGNDEIENLIVMCPNCHQHRYHRCGEFTRDQLRLYKKNLQERAEVERRLLQNLEDIRAMVKEKSVREIQSELQEELTNAINLINPTKTPRLAKSVQETAREMAEGSIFPGAARKAIELEYEIKREQTKAQFPPIEVTGVDHDAYRKSNKFGRAYEFVLVLNLQPHPDWTKVFDREYEMSWYNMKRETHISGDRIIMIVADSDDLQRHADWVKELIHRTNEFVQKEGFRHIDMEINREKTRALEVFDAIQSMKDRTKDLRI